MIHFRRPSQVSDIEFLHPASLDRTVLRSGRHGNAVDALSAARVHSSARHNRAHGSAVLQTQASGRFIKNNIREAVRFELSTPSLGAGEDILSGSKPLATRAADRRTRKHWLPGANLSYKPGKRAAARPMGYHAAHAPQGSQPCPLRPAFDAGLDERTQVE